MQDALLDGQRASTISLVVNAGLAVLKLACGIVGHSYALIADAVESLGDTFGSAIVRAGLVIAARPADTNHPYGHGKAEPLATLVVAGMLLAAAALIAVQAIDRIIAPGLQPAPYTLAVLIGIIVVKEFMYRYTVRVGRRIGSMALIADAWHHRTDALTSIAAIIGVAIAVVGGPAYASADAWAALFACVVIVVNGIRFCRSAVHELMDTAPSTHLIDVIPDEARGVAGALVVEKVLVRKVGPFFYADLHLEVDPELSVRDGHTIAHDVKDAIMSRHPEVADVLVHVEPYEPHLMPAPLGDPVEV